MAKLIVSEFVSLDGTMEAPGNEGTFAHSGWTMGYGGEEFNKFKFDELMAADSLLLGRITYEGFAAAWPKMEDEAGFADKMNGMAKYVVSTTLGDPEWNNSYLIKENVADEVRKLKEQPGKDILVYGSSVLLQTLMEENLVDEYRLLVYPVILGAGRKLFKEGIYAKLNLAETRTLDANITFLSYKPD